MAMSGSITEMSLVDLIQLACIERYVARLTVVSGDETARIFFSNGEIVHAELGDKIGPDALYHAVGWTVGDFSLDRGIRTDRATIQGAWTAHLLEALVRIDHSKKDAEDGEQGSAAAPEPAGWTDPGRHEVIIGDPEPVEEAAAESGDDWQQALTDLNGVESLVLVGADGMPHEKAPAHQDEQSAALAAFIGNAAKEIGRMLNLGDLDRAEVLVGSVPRVVLACGDCFAGLEVKGEHRPRDVAREARRILQERD